MRSIHLFSGGMFLSTVLLLAGPVLAEQYEYACPHITAVSPWINKITVYNRGGQSGTFVLVIWNDEGVQESADEYQVAGQRGLTIVLTNYPLYQLETGEIQQPAVEGTCAIVTENPDLLPKLTFRYGAAESLCEFFLSRDRHPCYLLPNTIMPHFEWTGVSVMNPYGEDLKINLSAYRNGTRVGVTEVVVLPRTKYVRLSGSIWPGLAYNQFDLIKITASLVAIPPPMSITGNNSQSRHVFFSGAPAGTSDAIDPVAGGMSKILPGTFVQGSLVSEPCYQRNETYFEAVGVYSCGSAVRNRLTKSFMVMQTEVTRQMWASLRALEPALPLDPSEGTISPGGNYPVQNLTWNEAVLFANLLTKQAGLHPCYWADGAASIPIDATNYQGQIWAYTDFSGYRLPTEAEWEYCCRAGTSTPFWVGEAGLNNSVCANCNSFPELEAAAWFCGNSNGMAGQAATRMANPWGLYDMSGNVAEWCWDRFGSYPLPVVVDYYGAVSGSERVVRGGAFDWSPAFCRSAARQGNPPAQRSYSVGFRLVRSVN